jgi:hypothetical protein
MSRRREIPPAATACTGVQEARLGNNSGCGAVGQTSKNPATELRPGRAVPAVSVPPVEPHLRFAPAVVRPGIPKLDALDYPPIPADVDDPRRSAGPDSLPDGNLLIPAIPKVDDYAPELDGGALNAQLDRSEPALRATYSDLVMVDRSIHICFPEIDPAPGRNRLADTRDQQNGNDSQHNSD